MKKYTRDGKVAVLYSPDYGGGWSTWNKEFEEELVYEPTVVEMLLNITADTDEWISKAEMYLKLKYPDIYVGDLAQLRIEWVPIGGKFRILENDGYETVEVEDEIFWWEA